MTLKITINHEGYTGPIVGYSPIITQGLACWHFPKIDAENSTKNFAESGDAAIFGAPSILPGYMAASGMSDYLETSASETGDITILAVGRTKAPISGDSTIPTLGGNFELNVSGVYLGYRSGGTPPQQMIFRRVLEDGTSTAVVINNESYDATEWHFAAASAVNGGEHVVYHKTDGLRNSSVFSDSLAAISTDPITAGGLKDRYGGDMDIAFFAVYNRALSEPEIDEIYTQVKQYLSARNSIEV